MTWVLSEARDNIWITLCATILFAWLLQEILERKCGMAPLVMTREEIVNLSNDESVLETNIRLTKSHDHYGKYRIQTRGAVFFIKFIWCNAIFIMCMYMFTYPGWFYDHFIMMDSTTINFTMYRHMAASVIGCYSWELSSNRYKKLNYSVIIHHILSIIVLVFTFRGFYSPFLTWYGFCGVAVISPVHIAFTLRSTLSYKYPIWTKSIFQFALCYYPCTIILNVMGQIFLFYVAIKTGNVSIITMCIMAIAMIGWAYDDYKFLEALYIFSKLKYENVFVLKKDFGVSNVAMTSTNML
eukprot:250666_1